MWILIFFSHLCIPLYSPPAPQRQVVRTQQRKGYAKSFVFGDNVHTYLHIYVPLFLLGFFGFFVAPQGQVLRRTRQRKGYVKSFFLETTSIHIDAVLLFLGFFLALFVRTGQRKRNVKSFFWGHIYVAFLIFNVVFFSIFVAPQRQVLLRTRQRR